MRIKIKSIGRKRIKKILTVSVFFLIPCLSLIPVFVYTRGPILDLPSKTNGIQNAVIPENYPTKNPYTNINISAVNVKESNSDNKNTGDFKGTPNQTTTNKFEPKFKISAESALVMSYSDGKILWEKNDCLLMYPASTTKMLTAILAIENISDFSRVVEITENESGYYSTSFGLQKGDKITLLDLLKAMLIDSNNGAAIALADYISGNTSNFAAMMNKKAQELGAVNARFENPNGLDNFGSFNIATAIDLALIAKYCMQNNMSIDISLSIKEKTGYPVGTITCIWGS